MSYKIVIYGEPVLRAKATPVTAVTDDIRTLARDMLETMYAARGLGLAAEQVGRTEALCVIDVPQKQDLSLDSNLPNNPDVAMPLVLINPEIVASVGEQVGQEGCLSFPEIFATVKRAAEVTVRFMDLESHSQTVIARGLLARAVQHELDHLSGVLLVDRMSRIQKIAVGGRLKRLKSAG